MLSTDDGKGVMPDGARRRPPRLRTQFIWVAGGRALSAVLQAALFVLLARQLGPSDFGHVGAFLGLVTLAQVGVDLGLSTLVTRERAREPGSPLVSSALRLTTQTAAGILGLLAAGLLVAGWLLDPVYFQMLPLALWAALERNADVRLSLAFADGDAKVNVQNIVGRRALSIAIFAAWAPFTDSPVLAFSMASAIAAFVANAAARWATRDRALGEATVSTLEVLRAARPYWVNSVATQARNVDAALVAGLAGAHQSGLYASGSRITTPLRILPTSLASILIPHAARSQATRAGARRSLRIAGLASLAASVLYLVIAATVPFVVVPLLGAAYDEAIPVMVIVVLGLPFAAAASLVGSVLQGVGDARGVASSSTASTVFCIAGVAAAAPFLGAAGAALMLSMSYVIQVAALGLRARRTLRTLP
ncbi:MAG: lipopolysaccharide biosynthesis protein [Nocardioides alkalitolerans]